METVVDLPYLACRELLASRPVGRVAFSTPTGPGILAVRYGVRGDSLVLRAPAHSSLATHADRSRLAFEVGDLEPGGDVGWTVVARGRGRVARRPEERAALATLWPVVTSAALLHAVLVVVAWDELEGRRMRLPGPGSPR